MGLRGGLLRYAVSLGINLGLGEAIHSVANRSVCSFKRFLGCIVLYSEFSKGDSPLLDQIHKKSKRRSLLCTDIARVVLKIHQLVFNPFKACFNLL